MREFWQRISRGEDTRGARPILTESMADLLTQAALALQINVPAEVYAQRVMELMQLLAAAPVYSRKRDSILARYLAPIRDFGLDPARVQSGVILWNPGGGARTGDIVIQHTVSLMRTGPVGCRPPDSCSVPIQEFWIATFPAGSATPNFSIMNRQRKWGIFPEGRVIVKDTFIH